jgi:hypothetical protein
MVTKKRIPDKPPMDTKETTRTVHLTNCTVTAEAGKEHSDKYFEAVKVLSKALVKQNLAIMVLAEALKGTAPGYMHTGISIGKDN